MTKIYITVEQINNTNLKLNNPVNVYVEGESSSYSANLPDTKLYGYGKSVEEAVDDLIDEMCVLFEEFSDSNDSEYGKLPLAWKTVLFKLMSRKV